MPGITWIDDDFAIQPLLDSLEADGFSTRRISSAEEAIQKLADIAKSDLVIIDVMMDPPESIPASETAGGYRTGLSLARMLRKENPAIPLLAFSGATSPDVVQWFRSQPRAAFISKVLATPEDLFQSIRRLLKMELGAAKSMPQVFIVHGHDDRLKLEVKNFLQNGLHLPEPIILHEQPSRGKTIIEKFEANAFHADFAIVLLTPDDKMAAPEQTPAEKGRARQNVILELGYFLGSFGRRSGRVILLHKGALDIPSDIQGVVYIDVSGGVEAASEAIRRELRL